MNLERQPFQFELLSLIVYTILFSLQHTLMPAASGFSHESHLTCLSTTLKCFCIHINVIAHIYLLRYTMLTFLKYVAFPIIS